MEEEEVLRLLPPGVWVAIVVVGDDDDVGAGAGAATAADVDVDVDIAPWLELLTRLV